jgi:thiol-disulfide isomerase/thioredoxin
VIRLSSYLSANPAHWAALIVIAGAVLAGLLLPPPVNPAPAGPSITGEIQHFRLARNPRAAADAPFTDGAGKPLRLADFRGKVVLVNFWATWCAPCRREMPALDALQRRLGGKRFEVVAASLDRAGLKKVAPFYKELGLKTLGIYLDPKGRLQRAFGVTRFPTTVLIDASGREVGRLEGPAEWASPEAVALIRYFIDRR